MPTTQFSALKNQPNLNEVLLIWKAPSHPFKRRNRIFYQTVAALTLLLSLIVFFLHEFLLIGVILSVAFVVYCISTIPPISVEHKITPLGFENAGRLYKWIELSSFWFEEKWGQEVLVIKTHLSFPAQLRVVISPISKEKLKDILGKYLLYNTHPQKSWVEQASDWLGRTIPLETTS